MEACSLHVSPYLTSTDFGPSIFENSLFFRKLWWKAAAGGTDPQQSLKMLNKFVEDGENILINILQYKIRIRYEF
jgi:hypothetical protein